MRAACRSPLMAVMVACTAYNNNYNNYKTSVAPISSKRIEFSGAPSTGVGQTHIRVRCKVHQQWSDGKET